MAGTDSNDNIIFEELRQTIQLLSHEIDELENKLLKLEEDFESLNKPKYFLDAYPLVLKELNRRALFQSAMETETTPLNELIRCEQLERKKFLQKYGDDIPRTFIPSLESRPYQIQWSTDEDTQTPVV